MAKEEMLSFVSSLDPVPDWCKPSPSTSRDIPLCVSLAVAFPGRPLGTPSDSIVSVPGPIGDLGPHVRPHKARLHGPVCPHLRAVCSNGKADVGADVTEVPSCVFAGELDESLAVAARTVAQPHIL